ncbi:hypothetical protein [Urechidicola croceus]|uniref:DUF4199 domain-containing protein n=1 Tax=Urechidicola croceus TaxID=1850246 RepID=A0A1D8P9T7_9FLAO|nr:hypothetical protein [Urechidicola croceus]AOW21359.1 hypothetical protein LPB138_12005 [Urechidicola croceus]
MGVEKIVLKNAIKIFLGIVVFFFLMKLLRLEHITQLRVLNFAFVFWGINSAIKENFKHNQNSLYLQNLFIGLFTSLLSLIFIIVSFTVYLFYIEPSFINVMEDSTIWGKTLSPPLLAVALFMEGMASSIVCSFIVMQFWKNKKIPSNA